MGERYWFRARDYGWGWVPETWRGWTVALGIVGLAIYRAADGAFTFGVHVDFALIVPILALTALFIAICWWKGERLRRRWGDNG